jgi:DNA-binding IclR family transcriptional regulator
LFRYKEQKNGVASGFDQPPARLEIRVELRVSIEKAVEVLFHLHAARAPLGVTALGRELGLPKSSAHRLLTALRHRDLVEQDESGRYHTGIGLVVLGQGALHAQPLLAASRPILEREAAALAETVFLVAARGGRLTVLDQAEGPAFLRAAPRVGEEVPAHATAVGKLALAFAPEQVGSRESPLARFTDRTLCDAAALDAELARVRASGVAESDDEWQPGLSAIATPIWLRGSLAGSLAVAAPGARLAGEVRARATQRLVAAAAEIGARLAGASARRARRPQ